MKKTRAQHAHINMMTRCYNRNNKSWSRYGGRGVYVVERWRGKKGQARFISDMGEPPPGMTLERKDNDGPYSPDNCIWASRTAQALNRRTTIWVEIDGERMCATDWARKLGVHKNTLRGRAKSRGWDFKAAILSFAEQPVRTRTWWPGG